MEELYEKFAYVINLTEQHDVNILDENNNIIISFPGTKKTGLEPARLKPTTVKIAVLNGVVPLTQTEFGETINLPKEKEDTVYIVSRLILSANPDRNDLLTPNEVVKEGNIILGCKSLARN